MKNFKMALTAAALIVLMAGQAQAQEPIQEQPPVQAQEAPLAVPASAPLATAGQQAANENLSAEEKQARVIADTHQKAERGDVMSQVLLGISYGTNVQKLPLPIDKEKSLKWLNKAAEQDSSIAKLLLSADNSFHWIGNPNAGIYYKTGVSILWLVITAAITLFMMGKDGVSASLFAFSKNTFIAGLKKFISCTGRVSRSGYWGFSFFMGVIGLAVFLVAAFGRAPALEGLWGLIITIPSLTLIVRRLQDSGRSGWWLLLVFTIIGILVLIYWVCFSRGDVGSNRYGSDPRGSDNGHGAASEQAGFPTWKRALFYVGLVVAVVVLLVGWMYVQLR